MDWHDLARDILNFLTNFLPCSPSEDIDTVLKPVLHAEDQDRGRRVIGVGHSFGGTVLYVLPYLLCAVQCD